MGADQVKIEVPGAPDAVWAMVGDFGGLEAFFPGISGVRLEGDVRVIPMGEAEVREQLLERDDAGRMLRYSVIAGMPLEQHEATVTVEPSGSGSLVTWAFDVKPDEMTEMLSGAYATALEALRSCFAT